MKKTFAALAVLALSSVAFAADGAKTYKVNGTVGAGATTLQIGAVANDKVDLIISGIAAVWKKDPGAAYGAIALQSEDGAKGVKDWVLSYSNNPAAFVGARQCILKRGADWPGTADLKSLKLDDARVACAPITVASAIYVVDVTGDYNVLGVIPVIEFKDGTRAWGSHPFGDSRGKDKVGQTITLLEVDRGVDNKATLVKLPTKAAKQYFAGNFQ
ncbi:MAG: hypothetical protein WA082_02395 [Candidatus Moraniibacteriota bacterium]